MNEYFLYSLADNSFMGIIDSVPTTEYLTSENLGYTDVPVYYDLDEYGRFTGTITWNGTTWDVVY